MRNPVLNLTPTMPSCGSIAGVIFIPPSWMVAHSMQHDEADMRYGTAKGYVNACAMIFKSDDYKDANIVAVILPMHLLAGFALELYLKAWLLRADISSGDVKSFGHNIASLYEKARKLGLPDIDGLEELKDHLAGSHADFTFRYIRPGDEMNNTNWPLAFKIFYNLDCQVDTFLGASAAHGLKPGTSYPALTRRA